MDITNTRTKTSGLAERTLKNLMFLESAQREGKDVHVVTQIVNSLLALLVFPVERETLFFGQWETILLTPPMIREQINTVVPIPSLEVIRFGDCANVARFFRRIRNALSHKNIEFSSDSLNPSEVIITLQDKPPKKPTSIGR